MKTLQFGGDTVIIGRGSLAALAELPGERVFIVTGGHSMQAAGVIDRIQEVYRGRGTQTAVFSGVPQNPDTRAVLAGLNEMRRFKPDTVLAVGGGSPMDAAKVMAIMYEFPEVTFEAAANGQLPQKREKTRLIAVGSTSGTGSEVTRAGVITFTDINLKIGFKTPAFIPDVAILDADLTLSMPDHVVAETGMDAVTHAVEAYINNNLDDFTEVLAKGAVEGLFRWLPVSYAEKTPESREKVHNYQCIAGLAFDNVGLGMAHGISHAIGGKFGLGHGLTNAIALPYVLSFNMRSPEVTRRLEVLAKVIGVPDFVVAVRYLKRRLGIPAGFEAAGLSREAFFQCLPELVVNALKGSTRVNPVPVSTIEMERLLKEVFDGN